MFPIGWCSVDEIRLITGKPSIKPGEQAPAWLKHRVAWQEFHEADIALAHSHRRRVPRPRLVQKLRLVFARG